MNDKSSVSAKENAAFNFGYFYRTIEERVDAFAAQEGNPYSLTDIAVRVGGLLQAKVVRSEPGYSELVSQVRAYSEAVKVQGKVKPSKEVHVPAHGSGSLKRVMSKKARKLISLAQKARWAKWHAAKKAAKKAA